MNKLILTGNLTKDPEFRISQGGTSIANLTIANNEGFGDKQETLFIDITVFNKVAENCEKYLKKGSKILVEGRLKKDSWEDQEGKKHFKTYVIANMIDFLSPKSESNNTSNNKNATVDINSIDYEVEDQIPF